MLNSLSNVFSLPECEKLKKLLKNPEDDFQEIISLLERKVEESNKQFYELEEKYHSLINGLTNVGIGIDIVSKDYKVLFQNQILKGRFGDLRGKNCYRSYMGLKEPCEFCPMEEALKYNRVERTELDAPDGRSYELISAPFPNQNGSVDKVAEIVIDITDRKQALQKLKESEEKYRVLTEQSLMGIFIIQKGKFKYINQAVSDINGYSVEDMLNWTEIDIAKIIYSEDLKNIMNRLKRSEEGDLDEFSSSNFRIITKSGKLKWIQEYNKKIIYQGEPASLVTLIDITSKIKSDQKLRESENKYRHLFYYLPINISIFDSKGNLVESNKLLIQKLSEYAGLDFIGKNYVDIISYFKNSDQLLNLFKERLKLMRKGENPGPVELLLVSKEGKRIWLNWQSSRLEINNEIFFQVFIQDITEKKEADEKLKESEEKFRTIAEQSLIGIGIIQDNLIKYVNEKLTNILGYTLEEMLDWSPEEFMKTVHPKHKDFILDQARRKQEGIDDYLKHYQFKGIKKSGEVIWIENFTKSIMYEGRPADFVTFIDITEKKEAEEKLRESEEKYRNLFEKSPNAIALLNSTGKIIDCNIATEKTFGYSTGDLIGKKYLELPFYTKSMINKLKERFQAIRKELEIEPQELEVEKKDGSIARIKTDISYFKIGEQNYFQAIIQDITEQKKAEQKLKESEEKFRKITEESLLAICIIQDNLIKYVNQEMANLYGYTVEEMFNWKPGELLKTVAPDSLETVKEQLRKKQAVDPDVIFHYPIHGIRKNGELIWVDNISKTIMYEGRSAELITQIDITERINAQQELLKLNQLKSELLRRTSHELKTPLVSIKGFSDLLLEVHRDKLDAMVISTLNEIKQGCLRLENLIVDILKTAELESGAIELRKLEEDLSFLVRLCINEIKGLSILRNHTINLEIQNELKTQFEKEQIHQVISNLLTNAVKYTPPGGLIEIKSEIRNEFIIFSIKDNGIGFTEEEKTRIFKQFGKIERYGQGFEIIPEGSGFGLFISKKIIELHGGEIWLESDGRNKGTTFYFSLPLT